MTGLEIKLVTNEREIRECLKLRIQVFVEEQGCPLDEEIDEYDCKALHAAAIVAGHIVGTARMYETQQGETQIGRMAVDMKYRRQGIAERILYFLENMAMHRGEIELTLHAQIYVIGLYEKHCYIPQGKPFMDAGIKHVKMIKTIKQTKVCAP